MVKSLLVMMLITWMAGWATMSTVYAKGPPPSKKTKQRLMLNDCLSVTCQVEDFSVICARHRCFFQESKQPNLSGHRERKERPDWRPGAFPNLTLIFHIKLI